MKSRIDANPEFQLIIEDSKRLKERIDDNTLSLNLATREKERLEAEARRDAVIEDRAKRTKEIAERIGDKGFQVFHLNLDNVDNEKLVLESDFTREQNTGMRTAKNEDDENLSDSEKFPYGIEPVKLEAVHILSDLIDLERRPTTADKGTSTKPIAPAGSSKPQAQ